MQLENWDAHRKIEPRFSRSPLYQPTVSAATVVVVGVERLQDSLVRRGSESGHRRNDAEWLMRACGDRRSVTSRAGDVSIV